MTGIDLVAWIQPCYSTATSPPPNPRNCATGYYHVAADITRTDRQTSLAIAA